MELNFRRNPHDKVVSNGSDAAAKELERNVLEANVTLRERLKQYARYLSAFPAHTSD